MFLKLDIDYDHYFVSEANYLELPKVSSYKELKSMIAEYETETISKYNLVYETTNFLKDSK